MPERLTDCGLLKAPSAIVRVPVRVPVWLGVKTTLTMQFAAGASRVPVHPSLERLKSPEGVTVLICSAEAFGLVRVTFLAVEVVPTSCCGNTRTSGLMVNLVAACAGAVPIPASSRVAVAVSTIAANLPARAVASLRLATVESQRRKSSEGR
ncbi:MAG TPA: hypothetical protein VJX94_00555 [Stellaceae bacterium]|nr:hypothetical protein [Stellaceae bacterium]